MRTAFLTAFFWICACTSCTEEESNQQAASGGIRTPVQEETEALKARRDSSKTAEGENPKAPEEPHGHSEKPSKAGEKYQELLTDYNLRTMRMFRMGVDAFEKHGWTCHPDLFRRLDAIWDEWKHQGNEIEKQLRNIEEEMQQSSVDRESIQEQTELTLRTEIEQHRQLMEKFQSRIWRMKNKCPAKRSTIQKIYSLGKRSGFSIL